MIKFSFLGGCCFSQFLHKQVRAEKQCAVSRTFLERTKYGHHTILKIPAEKRIAPYKIDNLFHMYFSSTYGLASFSHIQCD